MIASMTGFGKGVEKSPYGKIIVEIKSLNHKSLSIACSPFNGFFLLEEKAKKVVEERIYRGKVFMRIGRESTSKSKSLKQLEVNVPVARDFLKQIRAAQKKLGIGGEMGIRELIAFPGVIETATEIDEEKLWPFVQKAMTKALDMLVRFRRSEGMRLFRDFRKRLARIKKINLEIAAYNKESVENFRVKLKEMITLAKDEGELDKGRIESEVALFERGSDVTEEMIRLKGHISSFMETMREEEGETGKKLDFIAQEMQREANTIGSKSSDLRVSKAVIEVKSEIERIREQIKNIE